MSGYVQVSTTTDSRDTALALARSVVKARLAASAQLFGPVTSVFWHQGEYGEGEEWQLWFKTTSDRYAELEAHLVENHGWQKPEVTAVPIVAGSSPYLSWVKDSTAQVSRSD